MTIDSATWEGLHPSDRLALHFHAVLNAPEEAARRCQLSSLDAWIAELGPRYGREEIESLLTPCSGTSLEPMRLGPDASELAVRFVQIVFSERVDGSRARIVSEDTLGISGGLSFRKNLETRYLERRRGKAASPGSRGDWYFAPAGLRPAAVLERTLRRPLRVSVQPSEEHGFVLALSITDRGMLRWDRSKPFSWSSELEPASLSRLATNLEGHSSLGETRISLDSLLSRLPQDDAKDCIEWVPETAEAIVRFSALLAGGHLLNLDPGRSYPRRTIASVALALPQKRSTDLDVWLKWSVPLLTGGLWINLGDKLPPLSCEDLPHAAARTTA